MQDDSLHPSRVVPDAAIIDHFPVILTAPCALTRLPRTTQRLILGGLTDEEWEEKKEALGQQLTEGESWLGRTTPKGRPGDLWNPWTVSTDGIIN